MTPENKIYIADKPTLDAVKAKVDNISASVQEIAQGGSGGIAPSNMIKFSAFAGDESAKLYIEEPGDTIIDSQVLSTIAGVKIMRSETGYPETEKDGSLVIDIKRENFGQYKEVPYEDAGLANGTTYYYAAFPYSDQGVYNRNPQNKAEATPKQYELYGFDIDQDDSNPATRISYPSDVDNAEWDPMTVNQSSGAFDLGRWANTFFMRSIRPVMLKYDGTVDYELNHDDQSFKLDGSTASDISNTAYGGNAMVEFPKMYFKRWQDATGQHVRVSNVQIDTDFKCYAHMYNGEELDAIYLPMFEGSSVSSKVRSLAGQTPMNTQTGATEKTQIEANGSGWQFDDWMNAQMVTHLLFLLGKSSDLQATFGRGHYDGGSAASSLLQTGQLKNKGMFYGTNGNASVKFLWLENYYGDRWDRKYGVVYNTAGHILTKAYPPYNTDGSGYTDTGITITGTSGGYISKTKMTEFGEFPIAASGSETTYQPDGCWWNASQLNFLLWGAICSDGLRVGAAFAVSAPFSSSSWHFGPSLAYKYPKAA